MSVVRQVHNVDDISKQGEEGQQVAALFRPLVLRGITLRNRIGVSPMCEYSSMDGFATDWHLVHLGSRAVGGAALVMTEAAAVEARGRISPEDLGIYRDEHIEMLSRIANFIREQGRWRGYSLPMPVARPAPIAPGAAKVRLLPRKADGRLSLPVLNAFQPTIHCLQR